MRAKSSDCAPPSGQGYLSDIQTEPGLKTRRYTEGVRPPVAGSETEPLPPGQ